MGNIITVDVEQLKERLAQDANDIDAAQSLGNFYYDSGDAEQAILYYEQVLEINPALSGVRTDLGAMYWRNDNIDQAEQAFRDVIARDPGFGHAYVNLGLLLQHAKGDIMEARFVWQQLISIDPNHVVAEKARELLRDSASLIN